MGRGGSGALWVLLQGLLHGVEKLAETDRCMEEGTVCSHEDV